MSALTRNPANKDLMQSNKFRLSFGRLPTVTYFCQTANLPGLTLSEVPRNTPFIDLYVPGEKLMYDVFNITFLVDEDLVAWTELHDWIRALTFPTDFKEYRDLANLSARSYDQRRAGIPPQYSDGTLSVYTNKNNPNFRFNFVELFPVSLGAIQFSSMDSAENIITADASFRFSYYNIEKL